jgi:hypothetical protein
MTLRPTVSCQGRVWFGLLSGILTAVLACGGVATGSSSSMSGSSSGAVGGGDGGSGGGGGSSSNGVGAGASPAAQGQGAARALVATIVQSLSTNSSEVDVAVYSDASADRTLGPSRPHGTKSLDATPKIYDANSPEVAAFLSHLAEVGDVSAIPCGQCLKSTSFGTVTTVSVDGATSGDLQCLEKPSLAQAALAADCAVLTGH